MINVIFQATLTADPQQDTRNTKNSAHVYLSLCGKLDAKDPNNEQYKKSLFIQGSVWGKLAELCMNNLKKGNHILVFGTLYDVSTNESNGKVYLNTSMNITSFEFLDRAGNAQNAQQLPAPQPAVSPTAIAVQSAIGKTFFFNVLNFIKISSFLLYNNCFLKQL